MTKTRTFLAALSAVALTSAIALAGNTTFFTNIGDLVFPFTAPKKDGSAGAIDNMVIGATTPRAGTFTNITAPAQAGAAATTPTGTGGPIAIRGGTGGTTSGAGGTASLIGGAATAGNSAGGAANVTGGAATGTGNGGAANITGGASGPGATGNGGPVPITGGAATSTNGNGGSVYLAGGANAGTGVPGMVIKRSVELVAQGAPAAKTVSATLTAAEVLTGIITVNQGGAAPSAQQLPLATAMDTAFPDAAAGDAFDFSVINISVVDAEDASLTTNTGWTLVGSMDVPAYSAAGSLNSSGRFRARKTGTGAWTLYRLS